MHADLLSRLLLIAGLLLPVLSAHDDLTGQIDHASIAIAADPDNQGLRLRRAELYRLNGDLVHAQADLDQVRRQDPQAFGLDRITARVLVDAGDPAGARLVLDRHLARSPCDGDALAARAACAQQLGDAAAARVDLDAALRLLHHPDPDLICRLALLLHSDGRTDVALERLALAQREQGAVPIFDTTALAIERQAGRTDAALARLQRLAVGPAAARWLAERGDLLRALGRRDEAAVAFRSAREALALLPVMRRTTAANQALAARIEFALAR